MKDLIKDSLLVELCIAQGKLPEWVTIFPAPDTKGWVQGRDGRRFLIKDPQTALKHTRERALDLRLDYEHASEIKAPKGEEAPAAGWFRRSAGSSIGSISFGWYSYTGIYYNSTPAPKFFLTDDNWTYFDITGISALEKEVDTLGIQANGEVENDYIELDEFEVIQQGCICALPMDEGVGYQLKDLSINHYDGLLSSAGIRHLIPRKKGVIRAFAIDAYNGGAGNSYLLSTSRDILPKNVVLVNSTFINRATGAVTALEVKRSNGSNLFANLACANAIYQDRGGYLQENGAAQRMDYRRLALNSTDIDATDVDVNISYELLD